MTYGEIAQLVTAIAALVAAVAAAIAAIVGIINAVIGVWTNKQIEEIRKAALSEGRAQGAAAERDRKNK